MEKHGESNALCSVPHLRRSIGGTPYAWAQSGKPVSFQTDKISGKQITRHLRAIEIGKKMEQRRAAPGRRNPC